MRRFRQVQRHHLPDRYAQIAHAATGAQATDACVKWTVASFFAVDIGVVRRPEDNATERPSVWPASACRSETRAFVPMLTLRSFANTLPVGLSPFPTKIAGNPWWLASTTVRVCQPRSFVHQNRNAVAGVEQRIQIVGDHHHRQIQVVLQV